MAIAPAGQNQAGAEPPSIDDAESALNLGDIPASTNVAVSGTGPGGAAGVVDSPDGTTRRTIAYFLLWIMVGIMLIVVLASLVFSVNCWVDGTTCARATTALNILTSNISPMFTAMVGLVGSVVGFYFGSRQT
jgi:hypothetical protein